MARILAETSHSNPMKRNLLPVALAALTLAISPSCSKKETAAGQPPAKEESGAPAPAPGGTTSAPETPAPEAPKPAVSAAEVAPLIGQAANLPKDFETLILLDLGQVKGKMEKTELWKKAKEEMGISEGDLLPTPAEPAGQEAEAAATAGGEPAVADGEPAAAEGEPAAAVDDGGPVGVGTEAGEYFDMFTSGKFIMATGPGTGTQSVHLLKLMNMINKVTYRTALTEYASDLGLIEDEAGGEFVNPFTEMVKNNFDQLANSLEQMSPPVIYIAIEAKGKADKVQELQMLRQCFGILQTLRLYANALIQVSERRAAAQPSRVLVRDQPV